MIEVHWEFGDYAESYRAAARHLAGVAATAPENASSLALPVLFLYRHALELALKDAYVWTEMTMSQPSTASGALSVEQVRGDIQGHALGPLFERLGHRFDKLPAATQPTKPAGLHEVVGPAVAAVDGLDVDGQRLRYPYLSRGRGRSWSPSRPGPSHLDVTRIAESVEAALRYLLDVLGAWFYDVLDRVIEDEWLSQFWEAERKARRLDRIHSRTEWLSRNDAISPAHSDLIDDVKAEVSAELVDDA